MTKTIVVRVRLTKYERQQWLAAAQREGITSLSELVRAAVELVVARGSTT